MRQIFIKTILVSLLACLVTYLVKFFSVNGIPFWLPTSIVLTMINLGLSFLLDRQKQLQSNAVIRGIMLFLSVKLLAYLSALIVLIILYRPYVLYLTVSFLVFYLISSIYFTMSLMKIKPRGLIQENKD
jgi:hypothetical protein